MDMGPNSPFWTVFFWVNAVVCVTVGIWIVHRLEKEKKQWVDAFKGHYLRQFRWLFRQELKEHEIDEGTQNNEKAKGDLKNNTAHG